MLMTVNKSLPFNPFVTSGTYMSRWSRKG